uniref:Undecaprenyl-PP-MurNAc-pentapeptide-UDPGlcNAc GlcNAc transferase n=1 Tax=Paulinella micropora TaxID=1928728 RepID=A0A385I046_9EUKA|nr:Undecaprenyl-PP-MurNAc-pentapeptide-UDPGlcNAc GlcNAc transferase [Paulinella micropora]AXY63293.1 Undecaprenyl-PP-MurNAc-pentapeptide-UDPGlcNAc GlcNAc transferase [Paulinella micropora]
MDFVENKSIMANLLVAASGTGGHIFPALATVRKMPRDWKYYWLGVPKRLENQIVPQHYPLYTVDIKGIQGHKPLVKILQYLKLLYSSIFVYSFLRNKNIDIVFSTGGYIAAPTILAAYWYGIPVVLHESNAVPGKVTRVLNQACTKIAVGLQESAQFPNITAQITGTPVRNSFSLLQAIPRWIPINDKPMLLIVGGSQGAVGLNNMIRLIIPRFLKVGCRIIHITGKNDPNVGQIQHPLLIERPFVSEISALFQYADLVVTRAGAGSLSELSICCTPTVFIPFPYATDKHQDANACCASESGNAIIIWQHPRMSQNLAITLWKLLGPRLRNTELQLDPLDIISASMKNLKIYDADIRLASLIRDLV